MLSTIFVIAIFVGLLLLHVTLWALFLRLGLRWAKVADVTLRQILLATGLVIVSDVVLSLLIRLPSRSSDIRVVVLELAGLAAPIFVQCLVITRVFTIGIFRSVQAWLPTLLESIAMFLFVSLVLKPFIYEAFVSPTNAMAPTLLGKHWRDVCPKCGARNFCSAFDSPFQGLEPLEMICENFHVGHTANVGGKVHSPDRFLVAKYLAPRRWDLTVFQYPEEPSTLYVMRLVGLPGETIHIEDGAVWVNGSRLETPDALRGIKYSSEMHDLPVELWGTKDRPAVLGNGEYFVLGDFSLRSKDSRLWEQGAPGHNPFAVPESYLRGVVTHIYWPPQRWRAFR
jgi:signal peptidase I